MLGVFGIPQNLQREKHWANQANTSHRLYYWWPENRIRTTTIFCYFDILPKLNNSHTTSCTQTSKGKAFCALRKLKSSKPMEAMKNDTNKEYLSCSQCEKFFATKGNLKRQTSPYKWGIQLLSLRQEIFKIRQVEAPWRNSHTYTEDIQLLSLWQEIYKSRLFEEPWRNSHKNTEDIQLLSMWQKV